MVTDSQSASDLSVRLSNTAVGGSESTLLDGGRQTHPDSPCHRGHHSSAKSARYCENGALEKGAKEIGFLAV